MGKNSKTKRFGLMGLLLLLLLAVSFGGMVYFSPFGNAAGYNYKVISNTIDIEAPVDSVYKYLGNSANAANWSVFVDHIAPLNNDSVRDGSVGSRRRCFCNPYEQGTQWDELITEVVPGKKRQLTIYNLQNFPMTADNLATEQLYEPLDGNRCRLTFTVFFKNVEPTYFEALKTYIAAYPIKSIFEKNMANIKRFTEAGS